MAASGWEEIRDCGMQYGLAEMVGILIVSFK